MYAKRRSGEGTAREAHLSAAGQSKAITTLDVKAQKGLAPLVCLTAYTTPMAKLVDSHCDIAVVGDSVGMVLHGLPSTLGVI